MIELPTEAGWHAALELAEHLPYGWTLIGARMVELHGREHFAPPPRQSLDLDILAPVRLIPDSTRDFSRRLLEAGYEFDGASSSGVGHRFTREEVSVDVLAPDGLGERASLRTVAGARTVQVPGGSQALRRTERIQVSVGSSRGMLPRPDLLGAILVKARAVHVDDAPDDQLTDLAFLLSLVDDPWELQEHLRSSERRWLRRCNDLADASHPAWIEIARARDARAAYNVLANPAPE